LTSPKGCDLHSLPPYPSRAASRGSMEEVKDLIRKKWGDIISSPREVRQYWFDDYHQPYQLALNAVAEILDLAEKLKSKRRGKKSKDKISEKIRKIQYTVMAPGWGMRSLPKWDEARQRLAPPAFSRIVKYEYKLLLRLFQKIHRDVKELEKKGVRRYKEIYRKLSDKTYYRQEISPHILQILSDEAKQNPRFMNALRHSIQLKELPYEKFERIVKHDTPRDAAIEFTAEHFSIEPSTVVKKLGS